MNHGDIQISGERVLKEKGRVHENTLWGVGQEHRRADVSASK